MTALSKEAIFQTAEDFGCMIPSGPDDFEFFFYPLELEAFVKVCRADLVIENERLRILLNHE